MDRVACIEIVKNIQSSALSVQTFLEQAHPCVYCSRREKAKKGKKRFSSKFQILKSHRLKNISSYAWNRQNVGYGPLKEAPLSPLKEKDETIKPSLRDSASACVAGSRSADTCPESNFEPPPPPAPPVHQPQLTPSQTLSSEPTSFQSGSTQSQSSSQMTPSQTSRSTPSQSSSESIKSQSLSQLIPPESSTQSMQPQSSTQSMQSMPFQASSQSTPSQSSSQSTPSQSSSQSTPSQSSSQSTSSQSSSQSTPSQSSSQSMPSQSSSQSMPFQATSQSKQFKNIFGSSCRLDNDGNSAEGLGLDSALKVEPQSVSERVNDETSAVIAENSSPTLSGECPFNSFPSDFSGRPSAPSSSDVEVESRHGSAPKDFASRPSTRASEILKSLASKTKSSVLTASSNDASSRSHPPPDSETVSKSTVASSSSSPPSTDVAVNSFVSHLSLSDPTPAAAPPPLTSCANPNSASDVLKSLASSFAFKQSSKAPTPPQSQSSNGVAAFPVEVTAGPLAPAPVTISSSSPYSSSSSAFICDWQSSRPSTAILRNILESIPPSSDGNDHADDVKLFSSPSFSPQIGSRTLGDSCDWKEKACTSSAWFSSSPSRIPSSSSTRHCMGANASVGIPAIFGGGAKTVSMFSFSSVGVSPRDDASLSGGAPSRAETTASSGRDALGLRPSSASAMSSTNPFLPENLPPSNPFSPTYPDYSPFGVKGETIPTHGLADAAFSNADVDSKDGQSERRNKRLQDLSDGVTNFDALVAASSGQPLQDGNWTRNSSDRECSTSTVTSTNDLRTKFVTAEKADPPGDPMTESKSVPESLGDAFRVSEGPRSSSGELAAKIRKTDPNDR